MNVKEFAQRIADYYGQPVVIRKVNKNPVNYTQKDNSLILRGLTSQQTFNKVHSPEKRIENSAGVIFVHNHPSGDPAPSNEDREAHKKLKAAFGVFGINLLDSVVVGKHSYRSLTDEGL